MNNYNFSTLNDKEFEQIAKDLLNAKFNLELQNFRVGKDKGTDLRFSTKYNNNSIIVQAKHYIGSAFAQLKHTLLNKELDKIKQLNPDRYIVVTSLPLSAPQKDEIKAILAPYILSSNDVIGQEDLNGYLSENPDIEKKYFKLWFSSINVYNSIINNAIEGRSRHLLEKISKNIQLYVVTKKLDDANKILQKEKLLLITGQPGIGKTTLAEVILIERARSNYKIYKVNNITEAEDIISPNDDEKQIFYFDDFLGANYFEIINANKTETQLTAFVDRVKNTPNKFLILTTRTVILNHAIEKYEKISHSRLATQQFEIKLTDYSKYEKALILYNHIYFKGLRKDFIEVIINEKFYKTIIQHKNYTPRIIEFITDNSKIENFSPQNYVQYILNNLNNPREIWRFSFINQINYLDQCLLLTLFTFGNSTSENALIHAFDSRLEFEKNEHNQIISSGQFYQSIKILLNGFIRANLYDTNIPEREYAFINPSLTDFLIGLVSESYPERKSIVSSITFIEQLNRFNPTKPLIPLEKDLQTLIRDRISKSKIKILETTNKHITENEKFSTLMEALCKYCYQVNIDSLILEYFKQINYSENWFTISQKLEYVILNLNDAPQTFNYIQENFILIIEKIMESIFDIDSAKLIPVIFEKYNQDYDQYTESDDGLKNLINVVECVLQSAEDNYKSDKKDEIKNIDDVSDIYDEIYEIESELKSELFPTSTFDYDFGIGIDHKYWEDIIERNLIREARDYDGDYDREYYEDSRFKLINEDNAVDDLFAKTE
ncbi:restriction endonuclease [Rufibacter sediminis]|uniref:ATP-binding protein n=1 Tax=Rufibacter sediminis TaxID=2762756 RepID=A0ABR6VQ63_9BACT|nr:restriction endonuclease [Rufibacter sediminis]MBC3539292.1 ATP-binding protein [Rufibacter sediminis]